MTFGIGLVAAIVVDLAVDWLVQLAGYDAEGQAAEWVNATLDRVCAEIVDGEPDARSHHEQLRFFQDSSTVRRPRGL